MQLNFKYVSERKKEKWVINVLLVVICVFTRFSLNLNTYFSKAKKPEAFDIFQKLPNIFFPVVLGYFADYFGYRKNFTYFSLVSFISFVLFFGLKLRSDLIGREFSFIGTFMIEIADVGRIIFSYMLLTRWFLEIDYGLCIGLYLASYGLTDFSWLCFSNLWDAENFSLYPLYFLGALLTCFAFLFVLWLN